MSTVLRIEEIAGRLQEYQGQLMSLNEALDALKNVGELISAAMAEDRNALIGLALQMQDDAPEALDAPLEASNADDDETPCGATEMPVVAEELQEALVLESMTAEALAALSVVAAQKSASDIVGDESAVVEVVAAEDEKPDEVAPAAVVDVADVTAPAVETAEPEPVSDSKIIDLAQHRPKPRLPLPSRRRSLGFAAGLLVLAIGGTMAQDLMHGELFQRLLDLGSCDGEAVSANQDCALLAWMLL